MRRIILAAAITVIGAGLAACGSTSSSSPAAAGSTKASTASCSNASIQKDLYTKGVLHKNTVSRKLSRLTARINAL